MLFKRKKSEKPRLSSLEKKIPQIPIVFMGTPHFAQEILEALLSQNYRVVGVVTRPDKPTGRKRDSASSPVKELAMARNIPVFQPEKIDDEAVKTIANWKPDLVVVAAYGKILPESVLRIPGLGSINIHASLLPRWRGASPIQNALMAGDKETGITLMLMDRGMDTGPLIAQRKVAIDPDETAKELTPRLAQEGARFLLEMLPSWIHREITSEPQREEGVTLCQLIEREDGRIFWNASAEEIYNHYRGLSPWPGVFTYWKKSDDVLRLKLLKMSVQRTNPLLEIAEATVFETGEKIGVQTGMGVVFLEEVQLEGKDPLPIRDFLNGNSDFIGSVLS